MNINTFQTAKSFKSKYWMEIFNLIHKDLNLKCLPPKDLPIPRLLDIYWNHLWKEEKNIGKEFLNTSNIYIRELGRIWEYIQIVASVTYVLNNNLKKKKIISLGAGVEPCLFVFQKLGSEIIASDIYDLPIYWSKHLKIFLEEKPDIFCPYKNIEPNIKYINLNLKSKKEINKLGKFNVIYSVSSLEHIYSSFRKKKKLFKNIIKHLNEGGLFSFTTEVIIKYNKIRNYKKYIKLILISLKEIISGARSLKKHLKTLLNNITSIQKLKILIFKIKNLHRFHRRYDFFTIEELKILIKLLNKRKVYLVEKVDWKTYNEFLIKSTKIEDNYYSSISLTFCKDLKYKYNY